MENVKSRRPCCHTALGGNNTFCLGFKALILKILDFNSQRNPVFRTEQRRNKTLEWLQRALELENFPHRIEAFDISNLGSMGIVAAMTVFQEGRPEVLLSRNNLNAIHTVYAAHVSKQLTHGDY